MVLVTYWHQRQCQRYHSAALGQVETVEVLVQMAAKVWALAFGPAAMMTVGDSGTGSSCWKYWPGVL